MKVYEKQTGKTNPGTQAQIRKLECCNCGRHNTTKGVWNEATGRWYLAFTCPNCEVYQAVYVSEPREEKQAEKTSGRKAFKED
jgi:ribosomal protein L44E